MKDSFSILRVVAALILLGALGNHPYAYYQFLRWAVCGVTGYGAFTAHERKNVVWVWTFGVMAVVFNPIVPFYLQRETWQLLDIVAAVVLVISLFLFKAEKNIEN